MRWTGAVSVVSVLAVAVVGCSSPEPAPGPSSGSGRPAGSAAGAGLAPMGRTITGVAVDRVVDGDTIAVVVDGEDVRVRMIGIDTPETVKPDSPVECFGPEASAFAAQALTGATVTLELDASQGATDRYDRTLAYVWIEDPGGGLRMFNLEAVAGGYALEQQYGPTPYAWKPQFRAAEEQARAAQAGLWGACDYS